MLLVFLWRVTVPQEIEQRSCQIRENNKMYRYYDTTGIFKSNISEIRTSVVEPL